MAQRDRRLKPNILVTGTPGTGKTSTCSLLADATGLTHLNVGDLVKLKSLHDGWDDELECFILNEDLVRLLTFMLVEFHRFLVGVSTKKSDHACDAL